MHFHTGTSMHSGFSIWVGLGEWLLKWRWGLVILWGLTVLTKETLEHQIWKRAGLGDFVSDSLLYGLVFPMVFGITLTILVASRTKHIWTLYYQNLRRNLRQQLGDAWSHADIAGVFLQFLRVVMPIIGASVIAYDRATGRYESILEWTLKEGGDLPRPNPTNKHPDCIFSQFLLPQSERLNAPCLCQISTSGEETIGCYWLPLFHTQASVFGAHLYLPPGKKPEADQLSLLNEVAPEIETAFERVQLQQTVDRQQDFRDAEQKRMARDVHDSLGHSLAYLRLKLDQISMQFDQAGQNPLLHEVEALRDVAKEAYDQMREILVALTPEYQSNLQTTLLNYAERIRDQVVFKLDLQHSGRPRNMPYLVQRNVFYIFQEALTNIEKHANARQVQVSLRWHAGGLEMDILDDGIGFDPALAARSGHFGLQNMRHRAEEIRATLSIASQAGGGTRINLSVPDES